MEELFDEIIEEAKSMKSKPKLLVIVDADPRTNPRAAEALRMAGGVSVWGQVAISVVLRNAAARALGAGAEELLDGKMFGQFVPMVRESGGQVYLMPDAGAMEVVDTGELLGNVLKEPEFATLTAKFDYVMRF
jgi:hypothetical protein